jgi:hypothetical protein
METYVPYILSLISGTSKKKKEKSHWWGARRNQAFPP